MSLARPRPPPALLLRSANAAAASLTAHPSPPPLPSYAEKKIGHALEKHRGRVMSCEAHLTVTKNSAVTDAQVVEVTVRVKGGTVVRAEEASQDMYASIDCVEDRIARTLRKVKDRRVIGRKQRDRLGDHAGDALDEDGDEDEDGGADEDVDTYADALGGVTPANIEVFADAPVDLTVKKVKSFPMEPISVAEAAMCLDFIDHPFYVFRNKATDSISVVYKRNEGDGVGLIEPEQ